MGSTRVGAALAAVLAAVALAAPASAASAPTPAELRSPAATVDAAATWERESGCDQTEKKGPRTLRRLLISTYGLVPSNILRPCSAADSGHEEGRALDWMVSVRDPAQKKMADAFLAWLQATDEYGNPSAMARRLGIQYVIWNNQMWRPWSGQWSTYSDCDRPKRRFKAYDSTCHRNHVHVSFSWAGALGRTSYYTGYVACPSPVVDLWALPVTVPGEPVAMTPVAALRTKSGAGLSVGPCKVHPDVRLDLPVAGLGAVPLTGASAVTLSVRVKAADAPTELRVWQAGTEAPVAPALLADKGEPGAATVTVPVGVEGLVSLQLAGGMAHIAVDVVGVAVAAPPPPVLPPT